MLTDKEAIEQINKMVLFIEQEANEKIEEIDARGEEEYNIIKGREIQKARVELMNYYSKLESRVEVRKNVLLSRLVFENRIIFLKACDKEINDIINKCIIIFHRVNHLSDKYREIMRLLIIQGLCIMLEKEVFIRILERDKEMVLDLFFEIISQYKQATSQDCKLHLDTTYLIPSNSGGVILLNFNKNIKVDNTLETRLNYIILQLIPEVKNMLFGKNKNRKYYI